MLVMVNGGKAIKLLGLGLRTNALLISEDENMIWLVHYIKTYLVVRTYIGDLSISAFRL
jgi:hypothetical protein